MGNPIARTVTLLETPEVHVQSGVAVDVEVPAKGATGHVWTVETDPSEVRVLGHTKRPSEESFGGGGIEVFTLQPLRAGRCKVLFHLGAPWKKIPAEQHELSFDVS
jgi:predicted secreted protein